MIAKKDIPNLLTFARVVAVPVCLVIMLVEPAWKAPALLWIFVVAALTDFLDGYLARRWNVVSPIGALLDPIADKLLVALMLVYLLCEASVLPLSISFADPGLVMEGDALRASSLWGASPLFLPVVVILLRELYISGLREFLANRQIQLPVSKSGKWKTALQMVAIALLLVAIAISALPEHTQSPLFCSAPFAAAFSHLCDVESLEATPIDAIAGAVSVCGLALLYASALLAFTSAVSYTRASWKGLR